MRRIENESDLKSFAASLACEFKPGDRVALVGDLGAGKTSLVRSILTALGWTDPVASPTYSLMIEYPLGEFRVVHIDLYRLNEPPPWDWNEFLKDLVFVEWPKEAIVPEAYFTHRIEIEVEGELRKIRVIPLNPK